MLAQRLFRPLIPIGVEADSCKVKASSSFLSKRTKKLLLIEVCVGSNARPNLQKFLLLFSKRSAGLLAKGQPLRRMVLGGPEPTERLNVVQWRTVGRMK
jgi:hypothetical protein